MAIKESGEMYLETILLLERAHTDVHAVMVAQHLKVSKPSVSRALGILTEKGMIFTDADNHIRFTQSGRRLAEEVYDRHNTLYAFLQKLGVSAAVASADACRIEHVISPETLCAIKRFMDIVRLEVD